MAIKRSAAATVVLATALASGAALPARRTEPACVLCGKTRAQAELGFLVVDGVRSKPVCRACAARLAEEVRWTARQVPEGFGEPQPPVSPLARDVDFESSDGSSSRNTMREEQRRLRQAERAARNRDRRAARDAAAAALPRDP